MLHKTELLNFTIFHPTSIEETIATHSNALISFFFIMNTLLLKDFVFRGFFP